MSKRPFLTAREMSVGWTIEAVKNRSKTVTRRRANKWGELQPGERLTLTDGRTPLAEVEVVGTRLERLNLITENIQYGLSEVVLEGMGHMTPEEFVEFWFQSYGYPLKRTARNPYCRRIEWRYLNEEKI